MGARYLWHHIYIYICMMMNGSLPKYTQNDGNLRNHGERCQEVEEENRSHPLKRGATRESRKDTNPFFGLQTTSYSKNVGSNLHTYRNIYNMYVCMW